MLNNLGTLGPPPSPSSCNSVSTLHDYSMCVCTNNGCCCVHNNKVCQCVCVCVCVTIKFLVACCQATASCSPSVALDNRTKCLLHASLLLSYISLIVWICSNVICMFDARPLLRLSPLALPSSRRLSPLARLSSRRHLLSPKRLHGYQMCVCACVTVMLVCVSVIIMFAVL